MGDRSVIVIKGAPCAAYLHWNGEESLGWLKEAISHMRKGDDGYSMARLIADLCARVPGNRNVGVLDAPENEDAIDADYSHGDAGVIVYDCETGTARFWHGYLADANPEPLSLGVPPA